MKRVKAKSTDTTQWTDDGMSHAETRFLVNLNCFWWNVFAVPRQEMLEKLADKFERKVKSSATMRFFSYVCVSLTTASVCLNFQASLRESWLDDMMHVLEGEALGQDAATVEAAFKRHEAISTDVKARVSDNNL